MSAAATAPSPNWSSKGAHHRVVLAAPRSDEKASLRAEPGPVRVNVDQFGEALGGGFGGGGGFHGGGGGGFHGGGGGGFHGGGGWGGGGMRAVATGGGGGIRPAM